MTVEEDAFKHMNEAYDQIVMALDSNHLDREDAFALLAQMLCQLSQDDRDHFINKMNFFYSMEKAMRPEPKEMH